ncbi:MAG: alternative ribosome rescue aminoacyl-tRNA hydrolase ArfB [Aureliella sp.]
MPGDGIYINERYRIQEEELEWSFARSSGPGGQNVNKVNSKATMRWRPIKERLPYGVWNRFAALAKRYLTSDGDIVIQSQEHRDRPQNVEACRNRLAALLRQAWTPPRKRIKTKPSRASQRRRLDDKKRHSQKKEGRRRKDW